MIGLEYILDLYSITATELATDFGIAKQNISRWIKGERKIPVKYLSVLENKFKIPKEYIIKNIRKSDKLIIQKYKIESENDSNIQNKLQKLEYDIKRYIILEQIENLMFNENSLDCNIELYESLIETGNNKKIMLNILSR